MTLMALIILLVVALSTIMAFVWLVVFRAGRSGWVDAIWTFAVGAGGIAASLAPVGQSHDISTRQWLVAALVAVWSLRLGLHIAARTIRDGDDPRYRWLRLQWGEDFRRRLFWFLQIQAAAALLLILSIMSAAHRPAPGLGLSDLLGLVIFSVAVIGATLADRQLSRFGADPDNKGKVYAAGLWRFSRHPNYFFEWLGWVAYAAIAIDLGGSYLWGWFALAGPFLMYWLLVHVSGIPPLEAHMLRSRGDRFRDYQQRVNTFWPGPPTESLSDNGAGGSR
ncbi:MAG: DUF1295 domain-containing protein [Nitrococcus sp.]|nr:DUF1295 domain-containing protein [Nitrococcus sp.]